MVLGSASSDLDSVSSDTILTAGYNLKNKQINNKDLVAAVQIKPLTSIDTTLQ